MCFIIWYLTMSCLIVRWRNFRCPVAFGRTTFSILNLHETERYSSKFMISYKIVYISCSRLLCAIFKYHSLRPLYSLLIWMDLVNLLTHINLWDLSNWSHQIYSDHGQSIRLRGQWNVTSLWRQDHRILNMSVIESILHITYVIVWVWVIDKCTEIVDCELVPSVKTLFLFSFLSCNILFFNLRSCNIHSYVKLIIFLKWRFTWFSGSLFVFCKI